MVRLVVSAARWRRLSHPARVDRPACVERHLRDEREPHPPVERATEHPGGAEKLMRHHGHRSRGVRRGVDRAAEALPHERG
ncbi:hypothetical protein [Nonomuraea sp. B19D2]|uniref:hypothetical protein n=1 Tax=Nonomuraea sp. B19D2 TaxID=3159561 RepID=UPI0032DAFAE0